MYRIHQFQIESCFEFWLRGLGSKWTACVVESVSIIKAKILRRCCVVPKHRRKKLRHATPRHATASLILMGNRQSFACIVCVPAQLSSFFTKFLCPFLKVDGEMSKFVHIYSLHHSNQFRYGRTSILALSFALNHLLDSDGGMSWVFIL